MADLNQVSVFAKVVEAGSFSAAARALGAPKASVSRKIAALEADLGARLLHRTTRRVQLTALGQRYYDEVNGGLARLRAAEEHLSAVRAVPSGTLRVAAPVEVGAKQLVDLLPAFFSTCPEVDVELVLHDGMVDLVGERIDVAIRTGKLASSSFVARKVGATRRVLVASPVYLRKRGVPKRVHDLHEHDCVIFGPTLEGVSWRLDGPHGRSEVRVRGRIAVDSARAAMRAAIAGLGVALLPLALVQPEVDAGALRVVLPRHGVEGGGLYLVFPSNRYPSSALRAFVDFVEPRLRKTGD